MHCAMQVQISPKCRVIYVNLLVLQDDSGIGQTSSLLLSPTQDQAIIKPCEIFGKQDPFVTPSTNLSNELCVSVLLQS